MHKLIYFHRKKLSSTTNFAESWFSSKQSFWSWSSPITFSQNEFMIENVYDRHWTRHYVLGIMAHYNINSLPSRFNLLLVESRCHQKNSYLLICTKKRRKSCWILHEKTGNQWIMEPMFRGEVSGYFFDEVRPCPFGRRSFSCEFS